MAFKRLSLIDNIFGPIPNLRTETLFFIFIQLLEKIVNSKIKIAFWRYGMILAVMLSVIPDTHRT